MPANPQLESAELVGCAPRSDDYTPHHFRRGKLFHCRRHTRGGFARTEHTNRKRKRNPARWRLHEQTFFIACEHAARARMRLDTRDGCVKKFSQPLAARTERRGQIRPFAGRRLAVSFLRRTQYP
jgi:hypothetical protein